MSGEPANGYMLVPISPSYLVREVLEEAYQTGGIEALLKAMLQMAIDNTSRVEDAILIGHRWRNDDQVYFQSGDTAMDELSDEVFERDLSLPSRYLESVLVCQSAEGVHALVMNLGDAAINEAIDMRGEQHEAEAHERAERAVVRR